MSNQEHSVIPELEQARKELQAWCANADYSIRLGIATATEQLEKQLAAEKARTYEAESELAKRIGVIDDFIVACGFNVNDGFELNSNQIKSLRQKAKKLKDALAAIRDAQWGAHFNNCQIIAEVALAETKE